MRSTFTIASLALAASIALAAPVFAQTHCAPRERVIERLQSGYGEMLAGGGLKSETQVLEIWAAPETGSWTVLITRADGLTCVMATGTNWHQQEPGMVLMGTPS